VRRSTLVLLLGAALCGGAAAAPPAVTSAVVLLRDGTVLRLTVPGGGTLARRRVGAPMGTGAATGRFLAERGGALYVLDPGSPPSLSALDAGTLTIRWQRALEPDVRYRGLVLAGGRLFAYGYRPGPVVYPADGLREDAAVVTARSADGDAVGSWTVRPAERHSWWEWWGASSADGRTLALTWHGGCGPDSGSLCTTGADLVDVSGADARTCRRRGRGQDGCIPEVHGAIEAYRGGWIATTGGETFLLLGRSGRIVRTLHSGLQEHLMSFALDAPRERLFVLGSCFFGREGLRVVSLATGRSRVVARRVCGSDPVLGPSGTLLAVAAKDVSPGKGLLVLARSTGRVLRRRTLPAGVLAVLRGP
jgi:hypothetical protein